MAPTGLASKIKAYVDFILTHHSSLNSNHMRETHHTVSWSPPPEGVLQLSVDAALFASSKSMGAGAVVRDYQGNFVAAAGDSFPNVIFPELGSL